MTDLTLAVNEILDRRPGYLTAEQYYNGTAEEVFTSAATRRALRHTGGQFRLNFAATTVNAVNDRLEITSVSTMSDEAGQYLDRVWASNELELEVAQVHKNALVYGDAYLIALPDEDSLQVYYNSPKTTVVIYDEENPRLKRFAAKMWEVSADSGKCKTRVNLYYPDRIEKYISVGNRLPHSPKDADFVPYVDEFTDADGIMPNPLGLIPVFHFRTERPQGKPEHLRAYGPQDAINKLVVTQMAANDFHGFPQRFALIDAGSNEVTDFDDDSQESSIEANTPGEMMFLRGVKEVGQFKSADPNTFIDPMRVNIRAMATITATPLHYFEPTGNVPSGEALRVAEAPLVKKCKSRQLSFGATWREVFSFILDAAGYREDVQVHWRAVETFDTKEAWEIARVKAQVGLPFAQNMAEMGYDTGLVTRWEQQKAAEASTQAGAAAGATPVQPADTTAVEDGSGLEAA